MKRSLCFLLLLSALVNAEDPRVGLQPIVEVPEPPAEKYPSDRYGKVAVVQWAPFTDTPLGVNREEAERYKAENRAVLDRYIEEAADQGARLVVTPEFATLGYPDIPELPPEEDEYRSREDIAPYVEPIPGPTTNHYAELAKKLGIYIHVGFAEEDLQTGKYHNTVAVLDSEGRLATSYRKMNLYKGEYKFLSPGSQSVIYRHPLFGKIGLAICADIMALEPMNIYALQRVNALALSTSWIQMNTGMHYFQLAALRLGSYLLAANQIYFPDSGVINPVGTRQSHIRQSVGIAYGYLPYQKKN